MTKLIIQIPCFNEEETLPVTLKALPKKVSGIDVIERLIVDDGSTDATLIVAAALGVERIVKLPQNQGLARAFMAGIEGSLAAGADIIVNTDADNQYCADDIEKLVAPVVSGEAEIVVGSRPIDDIEHFSWLKKRLQRFGSWVVRRVSGTDIADAPSGFRAFSSEAAMRLNVFSEYTYTLETIIEAGQRGIAITSVPIRTNGPLRKSRLIRSVPGYLWRSIMTILRIFLYYKPLKTFAIIGAIPFALGFLLGVRYLVFLVEGTTRAHTPSLILAAILILTGILLWMSGLIGDLLAVNRKLLEDVQLNLRRQRYAAAKQTLDC
ncbi:MAG: glycosyltransferase family 2 protein [Proteobacteria bacterium]|nr:glycosyltransferase family 2 protein [Pseudomonadota bacterium]